MSQKDIPLAVCCSMLRCCSASMSRAIKAIAQCLKDNTSISQDQYGVATMSRLLQIIGLFCKRAL